MSIVPSTTTGWRELRLDASAHGAGGDYRLLASSENFEVSDAVIDAGWLSLKLAGQSHRLRCRVDASSVFLHDGDQRLTLSRLPAFRLDAGDAAGSGDRVLAPMPGRIVLMRVVVGDIVDEGQELGVMEAMKMELALRAPRAGVIAEVRVATGDFVEGDALLIRLEA